MPGSFPLGWPSLICKTQAMRQLMLMISMMALVGCGEAADPTDDNWEEPPHAQEKHLSLSEKQLTELPNDLEKLTELTGLNLGSNQLTDVKGLEKLTQLKELYLQQNQLTSVKGL